MHHTEPARQNFESMPRDWHTQTAEEVVARLESNAARGLTSEEAESRLAQ